MELNDYLTQVDRAYKTCPNSAALEVQLTALLDQCGQEHKWNSVPYASLLGELGSFYRGQGRCDEAEARFRQALALLEVDPGRNSAEYATALNNLTGVHRLQRRWEEALEEFNTCLGLYRDTVGEDHVLFAAGLNNMSLVYLDRREWEIALALQEGAAGILARSPQARDELAASLCNQGALCQRMGRLKEAEEKLNEALSMFREELGTDTPHYHAALNTLGTVHYAARRFRAARDCFDEAARAAQALFGPNHYEVLAALDHRALAESRMEETL